MFRQGRSHSILEVIVTWISIYFASLWKNWSYLHGGKRKDYRNCSVLYCVLKLCSH